MMHSHLDFGSGRERAAGMGSEINRNRLESRLSAARRSDGAPFEELAPSRTGMAARSVAVVMALFR